MRPLLLALFGLVGCARSPSPLYPVKSGSVGLPHRGVLTDGAPLPDKGEGWRRLRKNERRYGTAHLVEIVERAAETVARERPGGTLVIGDLSAPHGGHLREHLSHRSGRDADLLLYLTTLDGAPVVSPGFIPVRADGLAWDRAHERFLRFDVEREWLLIKTLVLDEPSRVQWIFANHVLQGMLIEWALAKGEPIETIRRAEAVLLEPHPGGPHDDHVHVRVACDEEEEESGCEPNGPARDWFPPEDREAESVPNEELVRELLSPLEPPPPAPPPVSGEG